MITDQKLTDAQLAAQANQATAQANQAQAELERRQQERAKAEHQGRKAKAQQILDTYKDVEEKIADAGVAAEKHGVTAVQARDFSGAMSAWMAYVASRAARQAVIDSAKEAHLILGTSDHGIADLRQYTGTFSQWFDELCEKVARQEGYDQGLAAMGKD